MGLDLDEGATFVVAGERRRRHQRFGFGRQRFFNHRSGRLQRLRRLGNPWRRVLGLVGWSATREGGPAELRAGNVASHRVGLGRTEGVGHHLAVLHGHRLGRPAEVTRP